MSIDLALINFVVGRSEHLRGNGRRWTPDEDAYLRSHLGYLTDAEMGQALGRTATAVHLRWDRDMGLPGPSKAADVLTARRAAKLLGIDEHKIAHWVDAGLLTGRLMAGARTKNHTIRLIDRTLFRHWVLNPMNWVYFDPKKVPDPELRRMLKKRAARWGDEWWTIRQVADYHGVSHKNVQQTIRRGKLRSFHLPISRSGRHWDRAWSNHFVRRSDALAAGFYQGKGNHKPVRFTPAADEWILKAREELGMTFIAIGRTMKIGKWKYRHRTNPIIVYRYRQLVARAAKSQKRKQTKR
jgi:hypothetical protein